MLFDSKVALKSRVLFETVSGLLNSVNCVIIINNLVLNTPDWCFDCKLGDFCCECNAIINILTNIILHFWRPLLAGKQNLGNY